ncbi:lamin tail domain-containing protein [Hyalangium sp.]|uniref:lamin tail domain-containing protein n=1 Tax=Hyalangium sp. TaxID=2028555 RepID=UPI002D6DA08F|nr:lamin tail domain-containing protein [Hyalangium sp.]HYI02284.1 lamin tail domain-containing protein [Hyalangium sp.]
MSFARVARVLVVLTALCACSNRGDADGPLLPTTDLPSTTVGLDYEVRLTATGGVPPLSYSVGDVPPGFSFYSGTALLTGPSTAAGDYTLTIGVTDAQGAQDSRTYALRVYAAPSITSATVPSATSGLAYEFVLGATGGQPPLRWTLADGSLPPSVSLSSSGNLSGVPGGQGSYPFTVRVQDANGALATRQLSLEVRGNTPDGGTPDAGTPFPLGVGNWNVEWFGNTSNGPTDEQLQLNNVRAVVQDAGVDFWAMEEIVDVNHFNALKQGLPGYDGFVANDARVTNGTTYYSSGEQKLAVLYKSSVVQVLDASVILGATNEFDFAGRPPLLVNLRVTRNGTSLDMVAIVLHMKAESSPGTEDYDRRKAAGVALKNYLETQLPGARVIVLGDWNDDADFSIVRDPNNTSVYLPSPYQNYVDAPTEYTFLTLPLSQAGVGSSVGFNNVIDHQLVTNELHASYVSNSATVLRPTIPSYGSTTSDHYPILSRFDFGQVVTPPGPASAVLMNEFRPHPNNNPSTGQPDFDQQFVELINTGATAADLGGWKIHDAESYVGAEPTRHTFPAGTMLAPGKVYVVYSGASAVPAGVPNVDYANGNDGLRMNRGVNVGSNGDTLYLVKPDNSVADSHHYADTYQGISYNRSPDASGSGTWVRHDSLPPGLSASPGKRVDGTDF